MKKIFSILFFLSSLLAMSQGSPLMQRLDKAEPTSVSVSTLNSNFQNYTTLIANSTNPLVWRDGLGLVYYNNRLIMLGGWNDQTAFGLGTANTTTNAIYQSLDKGLTWTFVSNAPWVKRHSFGCVEFGGKIWVIGGDLMQGTYQRDIWTFDDVNGWVQVTPDWGNVVGDRILFSCVVHNGYIYIIGGQHDYNNGSAVYTDVLRTTDGITWTNVGSIPIVAFSAGTALSDGASLYIIGGMRYAIPHTDGNYNVYKSTNDGASFSYLSTISSSMTGVCYSNAAILDGRIYYLEGGAVSPPGNVAGLYYSDLSASSWTRTSTTPAARHASGICVEGNELYIVMGNVVNDVVVINSVPNFSVDSDTQNYVNYLFPTPTTTYVAAWNNYITAEKSAGNWSKIESIVNLAVEHKIQSWTNARQPTLDKNVFQGTAMSFTPNQGFQGNGSGYIQTSFNLTTNTLVSNINDFFYSVYCKQNLSGNWADCGSTLGGADFAFFSKWSDNKTYIGMGKAGTEEIFGTGLDVNAYLLSKRIGTLSTFYRNGTSTGTSTSTPIAAYPNTKPYVFALNYNDNAGGAITSRKLSLHLWGKGDINASTHNTNIQALAAAIGF